MPRSSLASVATAATLLVAGCSGGGSPRESAATSSRPGVATTADTSPEAAGTSALVVSGLVLGNPVARDRSFRVALSSSAPRVEVVLPPALDAPGGRLRVCPAMDLTAPRAPDSACAFPAAGDRAAIDHAPDYAAVDVGLIPAAGAGLISELVEVAELRIVYRPSGSETVLAVPPLQPGATVVVDRQPTATDPFRAHAGWGAEGGGAPPPARLTLEAGQAVVATAEGGPPLEAVSQVSPAAPARLTFANTGGEVLAQAVLTVSWP